MYLWHPQKSTGNSVSTCVTSTAGDFKVLASSGQTAFSSEAMPRTQREHVGRGRQWRRRRGPIAGNQLGRHVGQRRRQQPRRSAILHIVESAPSRLVHRVLDLLSRHCLKSMPSMHEIRLEGQMLKAFRLSAAGNIEELVLQEVMVIVGRTSFNCKVSLPGRSGRAMPASRRRPLSASRPQGTARSAPGSPPSAGSAACPRSAWPGRQCHLAALHSFLNAFASFCMQRHSMKMLDYRSWYDFSCCDRKSLWRWCVEPTCSRPCFRSSSDILRSRCCAATAAGSLSYSLSTFASDKMIGSVTRTSCSGAIDGIRVKFWTCVC